MSQQRVKPRIANKVVPKAGRSTKVNLCASINFCTLAEVLRYPRLQQYSSRYAQLKLKYELATW